MIVKFTSYYSFIVLDMINRVLFKEILGIKVLATFFYQFFEAKFKYFTKLVTIMTAISVK